MEACGVLTVNLELKYKGGYGSEASVHDLSLASRIPKIAFLPSTVVVLLTSSALEICLSASTSFLEMLAASM